MTTNCFLNTDCNTSTGAAYTSNPFDSPVTQPARQNKRVLQARVTFSRQKTELEAELTASNAWPRTSESPVLLNLYKNRENWAKYSNSRDLQKAAEWSDLQSHKYCVVFAARGRATSTAVGCFCRTTGGPGVSITRVPLATQLTNGLLTMRARKNGVCGALLESAAVSWLDRASQTGSL